MSAKKTYKLDLSVVLNAIDRRDLEFYDRLSDEDKKSYQPLVLMRYMSSLKDQNANSSYAILATNDLVNIGFWNLSNYKDLQHLLLCVSGLGKQQYRPWVSLTRKSKSNKINEWLYRQYPQLNEQEIEIIKDNYDLDSWKQFLKDSGLSDAEMKELVDAWKKQSK